MDYAQYAQFTIGSAVMQAQQDIATLREQVARLEKNQEWFLRNLDGVVEALSRITDRVVE